MIRRSIFIDFAFYAIIAVAGFLSNFDQTDPIVLKRKPLPGRSKDVPLLIACIAVMACIMVAYPVNYNPFRQHFFSVILGRDEITFKENFLVTFIFITLTTTISVVYPNIKPVISIMGGLIAVSMCYLVPIICQIKLSSKPWHACENLSALLFFGTLILIGYTSVIITVYEIVTGAKTMPRNE